MDQTRNPGETTIYLFSDWLYLGKSKHVSRTMVRSTRYSHIARIDY